MQHSPWTIPCSSKGRITLLSVTYRMGGEFRSVFMKMQGGGGGATLSLGKIPKFPRAPLPPKKRFAMRIILTHIQVFINNFNH